MMGAGISAKTARSSRSKPVATTEALANTWRCFADIGAAAKYVLRPRHPRPVEGHPHDAAVEAAATASLAAGERVDTEPESNAVAPFVPDQQEIERRRNLVRIFFNDFWSGASNKPAAFVERLDEAEDYLNQRLAANGESWRVDAKTRVMLGLPPRSNSSLSANLDLHTSGKWQVAWTHIAAVARQFEDFQIAERIGAILMAESVDELAANMRIPTELFAEEWRHVETLKKRGELDRYERRFFVEQHLMPPFCAVKVSGALFHTQGGSWSMPPVA